jgi:hypothetical protein
MSDSLAEREKTPKDTAGMERIHVSWVQGSPRNCGHYEWRKKKEPLIDLPTAAQ